jgi:hypothetical protein
VIHRGSGAWPAVEWNVNLHVRQGVAELVEIWANSGVGLGSSRFLDGNDLGFGPENIGGQDINLGCLVDGLDRVLLEQRIAPGDQIVEIRHHGLQHVGGGSVLGYDPRLKRILHPGIDTVDGLLEQLRVLLSR